VKRGLALLGPKPFDRLKLFLNDSIHFFLVIAIIGKAAINLSERQKGMLALYLIGVPMVGNAIQSYLNDLDLGAD
jgi:hypothetical protein